MRRRLARAQQAPSAERPRPDLRDHFFKLQTPQGLNLYPHFRGERRPGAGAGMLPGLSGPQKLPPLEPSVRKLPGRRPRAGVTCRGSGGHYGNVLLCTAGLGGTLSRDTRPETQGTSPPLAGGNASTSRGFWVIAHGCKGQARGERCQSLRFGKHPRPGGRGQVPGESRLRLPLRFTTPASVGHS